MSNRAAKDRMIEAHVPLARGVARRMAKSQNVSSADERDEMCADALFGLVQAAERWQPDKGVTFGAFARKRVAGAVIDGQRRRRNRVPTISLEVLLVTS